MKLWQGNEACVEGALAAGATFYAGYPITPSTEIAEIAARRLPRAGGAFIQMEDEIAGIAAVIGASVGGAKAFTATSGPGFSLMQENLGYAVMAEIPCVIVNVQRLGPSTGVATAPAQGDVMQARWGTHGDHPAIVFCPSSVAEVYRLTVRAFSVSEMLRHPVILLMDEVVGHMRENVAEAELKCPEPIHRLKPSSATDYLPFAEDRDVSPLAPFGEGFTYTITGLAHDEQGFPSTDGETVKKLLSRLHRKIERRLDELTELEAFAIEDAALVVVCYGCTARPVKEAVKAARREGLSVGYLRLATLWPFPSARIRALSAAAGNVLVPEMNLGQLVGEVERAVQGSAQVRGVQRYDGEMFTPAEILQKIKDVM